MILISYRPYGNSVLALLGQWHTLTRVFYVYFEGLSPMFIKMMYLPVKRIEIPDHENSVDFQSFKQEKISAENRRLC
jgi:hypothetical protein